MLKKLRHDICYAITKINVIKDLCRRMRDYGKSGIIPYKTMYYIFMTNDRPLSGAPNGLSR